MPGQEQTHPPVPSKAEALLRAPPREADTLLVVYQQQSPQVFRLPEGGTLVLGRDPSADIPLTDESVSRRHVRFLKKGGAVSIVDLGSSYGTLLNGKRVEHAPMAAGDEVRAGNVSVVIHALAPLGAAALGLLSHDQFLAALDDEVARSVTFQRGFAVAMARPASEATAFAEQLRERLRRVDRLALYGDGAVELLLPELGAEGAAALFDGLDARFGVALYPRDGSSPEGVLDAARGAMQHGSPRRSGVQPSDLVFVSPPMRAIFDTTQRVGSSTVTVLLRGETGTGKEVLARLLHEKSPRAARPFVAINCGAIPATLVEGTLFGHERGAFSGAHASAEGVFEQAQGGSLLLDEIGELPLAAQTALLRVLEAKELRRVGGSRAIAVDVRVLAATHRDLEVMVKQGTFREDLLYRMNTVVLEVPPLRERPEEIAPLVERFLAQANALNGREVKGFDAEAMRAMLRYAWPGNIRELRNAVEHAVVVAHGPLGTAADLPRRVREFVTEVLNTESPEVAATPSSLAGDLRGELAKYETQVILEALRACGGNRTAAARKLHIPVRTLSHKIRRYGIKKLGFG